MNRQVSITLVVYVGLFVSAFVLFRVAFWMSGGVEDTLSVREETLPPRSIPLHGGGSLDSATLNGRPVVVLAGDLTIPRQREALLKNMAALDGDHQALLLITSDPDQLAERVIGTSTIYFSRGDAYELLLDTFSMQAGMPSWLVYDKHGTLRGRGSFDSDAFRYFVTTIVHNDPELTREYLVYQVQRIEAELRSALFSLPTLKAAPQVWVLFIAKASSGCAEMDTLAAFKEYVHRSEVPVVLIPVGTFTKADAAALIDTYRLPFQYIAPPTHLLAVWTELERRYGLARVNASALLVSHTGIGPAIVEKAHLVILGQQRRGVK